MPLNDDFKAIAARVSNWGRWGADDRRGTLNLVDQAAVLRGIGAARQGKVFSLTIPFDEDGPQAGSIPGRTNPEREMIAINQSLSGNQSDFCSSDDRVAMGVQAATHWDALAHVSYDDTLYNGVPASVIDDAGAHELGIDEFGPLVSRGVLLDIARLNGVDHFDDGHPITGTELEAALGRTGLTVEPGDILCVRTGQMHFLNGEYEKFRFSYPSPGLSTQSIEWLHAHDVGAVATDTLVFECFPPEDESCWLPVHMIHLRDMGLVQGQNFALDALAADCAGDGQYDFMLCATPIPFTRGLGGPVAPTAIK